MFGMLFVMWHVVCCCLCTLVKNICIHKHHWRFTISDGGLLDSTMNSDEEESQLIRMIVEREEEEESGVLNDAKDHFEKANMLLKVLLVLC
jgi:hypothetical protein